MARLTGKTVAEIQANRLEVAREFSQQYGVTLVLKGFRTLTASPGRTVCGQPDRQSRNGQGRHRRCVDGYVAGLLAQFPLTPWAKSLRLRYTCMVWRATLRLKNLGQHSMLAGDLMEKIPQAYKELTIVD